MQIPEDRFSRDEAQLSAKKKRTPRMSLVVEPRYERKCLWEFPTRSDSNWLAQLQKLAWSLKFWLQKLETLHYLGSENKGADQTARMRRLICAFVVRIWYKTRFLMARLSWLFIFRMVNIQRNLVIGESPVFAPNIVIGITFYGFEAGQKLVRSRSNYFAHDGQRAHIHHNWALNHMLAFPESVQD